MSLYKINVGDLPMPSDVNQLADVWSGSHDIGQVTFAPVVATPTAPTAVIAAGTGLGIGAYQYKVTYVTGYIKTNGTLVETGETAASSAVSVTTTSGNQKVTVTIPLAPESSVVARRIYRTKVGLTTFYLLKTINDNHTASHADTATDASLPATPTAPTANTTGTKIGDTVFDTGTNTTVKIKSRDTGNSVLEVLGDAQGTGRVFVGQSSDYGGGIEYNGDGSPATSDTIADTVTFFRRSVGVDYWTARYNQNSNDWTFKGWVDSLTGFKWNGQSLDDRYVNTAGDTMTGDLIFGDGKTIKFKDEATADKWSINQHGAVGNNNLIIYDITRNKVAFEIDALLDKAYLFGGTIWHSLNDGAGSGLDADLLDGKDSSAFLEKVGGTMTGDVVMSVPASSEKTVKWTLDTTGQAGFYGSTASNHIGLYDWGNARAAWLYNRGANEFVVATTTFKHNSSTVWTAGNDGTGSGLDADLLDGLNSSDFAREYKASVGGFSNAGWTTIAYVDGAGLNSKIRLTLGGTGTNVVVSVVADIIKNHQSDVYIQSHSGNYTQVTLRLVGDIDDNFYIQAQTNYATVVTLDCRIFTYGGEIVTMYTNNPAATGAITHDHVCYVGTFAISSSGGVAAGAYISGNKVWHAGNDGAGSGLDADLIRGQEPFIDRGTSGGTTDFNTLTGRGTYRVDKTSMLNAPSGYNWGFLNVHDGGGGIVQTYYADTSGSDGGIQFRIDYSKDGTWTAWQKVWTSLNDGTGSGLDADLLDGKQYTDLQAEFVNVAGDTMTGGLTADTSFFGNGNGYIRLTAGGLGSYVQATDAAKTGSTTLWLTGMSGAATPVKTVNTTIDDGSGNMAVNGKATITAGGDALELKAGATTDHVYMEFFADSAAQTTRSGYFGYGSAGTNHMTISNEITNGNINLVTNGTGIVQINSSKVWHAGNDGAGSGLDADLLDGLDSSQFLRSDINTTLTGTKLVIGDGAASPNATITGDLEHFLELRGTGTTYPEKVGIVAHHESVSTSALVHSNTDVGTSIWDFITDDTTNEVRVSGNKVWHAGNDGAGSGLDADLLDGIDSGSFLRSDVADTMTGTLTMDNHLYMDSITDGASASSRAIFLNATNASSVKTTNNYLQVNPNNDLVYYKAGVLNTVWHTGNDGTGSGLDADLLQGLTLSASGNRWGVVPHIATDGVMEVGKFVDFHLTDADTSDNTLRLTALDVDTLQINSNKVWHAGNDGTGSGLDADLLDGKDSTAFLEKVGGTMTGALTMGTNDILGANDTSHYITKKFTDGAGNTGIYWYAADHEFQFYFGSTIKAVLDTVNGQLWTGNKVNKYWHAGNDGAGSGLDADLLDGVESSKFVRNDTTTAQVMKSVLEIYNGTGYTDFRVGRDVGIDKHGAYFGVGADGDVVLNHLLNEVGDATNALTKDSSDGVWKINGNKVWHAGNDGSGSGLDADLLDGKDSTAFLEKVGGTMTGLVTFGAGQDIAPDATAGGVPTQGIRFYDDTDPIDLFMRTDNVGSKSGLILQLADNSDDYFQIEQESPAGEATPTVLFKVSESAGVDVHTNLEILRTGGQLLTLKQTDYTSGGGAYNYIGFCDDAGAWKSYVGHDSSKDGHFRIKNTIGDVRFEPTTGATRFTSGNVYIDTIAATLNFANPTGGNSNIRTVSGAGRQTLEILGADTVANGPKIDLRGTADTTSYSGNVVMYTDNAISFYLNTAGNAWIRGTLTQNSVREAKKNINPYQGNALEKINNTPIQTYHYKTQEDTDKTHLGVIVDESPYEIVSEKEDGIEMYAMTAMAWKAIQELSAEVASLKAELAALKNG